MVFKYIVSPSSATEDFIIKLWEAASDLPSAEVASIVVPAPHTSPITITFNGLDKVVHIGRMYGMTSANLYHGPFNVEPRTDIVTVFQPIRFKIGDGGPNTPAAGTDTYVNSALIGLGDNDYMVFRNNQGLLFPGGIHYTNEPVGGGFVLNPGDIFNNDPVGEEFTIVQVPKVVTTVVNDSVVGKWFAGFVNITSNDHWDSSHLRKLIRFSGSPQYTFRVTDNVPIGYGCAFQHFGNPQGTAIINFNNGALKWGTTTKTSITLASFMEACFVWDGTNWNVVYFADTSFVNAAATPPLKILGAGNFNIGDVPAGDIGYDIVHSLAIAGDYLVMLSIKSADGSNMANNDKIGITWQHHPTDKPNKFKIAVKELAAQVQNILVSWVIIKL